ncbi:hypothetical protein [Desulfosporosinus acididurans]|uniref:hypothetical protein n=1 Tax=Desulfosporosinus acididurans TaxID=476652 RepID=UPI0013792BCA|nr:hypothetical protein [Desulfosporosinus acididurans]
MSKSLRFMIEAEQKKAITPRVSQVKRSLGFWAAVDATVNDHKKAELKEQVSVRRG